MITTQFSEREEIIDKLERRDLPGLRDMFPTVRLKRQVDEMFTHYTVSTVEKPGAPRILFKDEEYIVVGNITGYQRDKMSYNGRLPRPVLGIWVMGKEDGMLWIHRLPEGLDREGQNVFEIEEIAGSRGRPTPQTTHIRMTEPTNETVRKMMGFDYAYREKPVFETGKRVRLQGDLIGIRMTDYDTYEQDHLNHEIKYALQYADENYKRMVRWAAEKRLKKLKPDLVEHYEDILRVVSFLNRKRDVMDSEELGLRHDFIQENGIRVTGSEDIPTGGIEVVSNYNHEWNQIYRKLRDELEYKYDEMRIEEEGRVRSDYAEELSNTKQHQLRFGNHVLVIGRASDEIGGTDHWIYGRIKIPEKTTGFLLHDEHGTVRLEFEPGTYDFRLLRRHLLG